MFFYMHKLLPFYNKNIQYTVVSWGSLAAILDVLELSHFRHFSSVSQNMHDIWPFFLGYVFLSPFFIFLIHCKKRLAIFPSPHCKENPVYIFLFWE
jgi:hypothetical protein